MPAPSLLPFCTQRSRPEPVPHCLRWGTRDSVLRGSQRLGAALAAAEQNPEAPLEGFSFPAKALSDLWGTLGDKECHVIRDGKVFVGKALGVTWESHGAESQIQPSKHVEPNRIPFQNGCLFCKDMGLNMCACICSLCFLAWVHGLKFYLFVSWLDS